MAFPTLTFSYLILPVFVAGSLLLRGKKGERWLVGSSMLFLLIFNVWILLACFVLTCAAYFMNKKDNLYIGAIILQFVIFAIARMVIVFQYRTILAPEMGILVTTVATVPLAVCAMNNVGYLLDVKNGRCQRARRFGDYMGFSLYLPALFTGPYFGYGEYVAAMGCRRGEGTLFFQGLKSYVTGLGKAVLLGAGMLSMWSEVNAIDKAQISPAAALLGLVAAAFAVYYILMGYNDMSVGISAMFGIEMTKGFDHPVFARGFIDFLRRFNIYVWNWTHKYVIGEIHVHSHVVYFVVWVVLMLLYGLHANLLIWGTLFGIFACAEYYFVDVRNKHGRDVINMLYSIPCILFGFIFFCYFDLNSVAAYMSNFTHFNLGIASAQLIYLLTRYFVPLAACVLFSLNIPWHRYAKPKGKAAAAAAKGAEILLLALLLVAVTAYLASTRTNPFLLMEVNPL